MVFEVVGFASKTLGFCFHHGFLCESWPKAKVFLPDGGISPFVLKQQKTGIVRASW